MNHSTQTLFALITLVSGLLNISLVEAEPKKFIAEISETFQTFDARQGVAVDAGQFYAVNNVRITRHEKRTGAAELQWDGGYEFKGPLDHLDSGMVWQGRLYAAHSNYPFLPMTSSVEIWDTRTMAHVASHNFGILLGSMTWLDRYRGEWWGAFANYDKVQDGTDTPYGGTHNTVVVRMDDEFQVLQNWTLPDELVGRMKPMSNSGGSWGPDDLLYLTGHDYPEIYVVRPPVTGSQLEWVATVEVAGLNGQGIAWDRSVEARDLWAILKQQELVFRIRMPEIASHLEPANVNTMIRSPDNFALD